MGAEGDLVGRNIVDGPTHNPDCASIATAVYTVPALAAVGLTEAAAKANGLAAKIHVNARLVFSFARHLRFIRP
jgi:glutathione reductase (NADPH)